MAETSSVTAAGEVRRTTDMQPHTRQVLLQEKIANGVLWIAAGLTVAVLTIIVGYIVINGFYTRTVTTDPVMPVPEEQVPLFDGRERVGRSFTVLAPSGLRLPDLVYGELRAVFSGLQRYLGYLTEQNVDAVPVIYDRGRFVEEVADYLMLGDTWETPFADQVQRLTTLDEVQAAINSNSGAIVILPSEVAADLSRTRTVAIRDLTVVTHPEVVQLQAGRRLEVITHSQAVNLISGSVESWEEIGGPSVEIRPADRQAGDPGEYRPLPVRPVVLAPDTELGAYLLDRAGADAASGATAADGVEEFVRTIGQTPGAVGVMRARDAIRHDLPYLKVERVTHSANLRLSTIVEPPSRAGAVGGLSTIIINTLVMVLFVILITTPIGVAAAVYLVEYARQGRLLDVLRLGTDTLAGVPSIIFGLFGMVFFADFLGFQTGLLSGTLTLTLMILPTVVRTSEEALKSVPNALREGSFALGATKVQTIFRVVLPAASPGIVTGMILGIGRAVGETAALLFTMGSNLALIRSLNSPMRVLSVHLYMLIRENISVPNAFAAATILVAIVFVVNGVTNRLIGRMNRTTG